MGVLFKRRFPPCARAHELTALMLWVVTIRYMIFQTEHPETKCWQTSLSRWDDGLDLPKDGTWTVEFNRDDTGHDKVHVLCFTPTGSELGGLGTEVYVVCRTPIKRRIEVDILCDEKAIVIWDNGPGMSLKTLHEVCARTPLQLLCLAEAPWAAARIAFRRFSHLADLSLTPLPAAATSAATILSVALLR